MRNRLALKLILAAWPVLLLGSVANPTMATEIGDSGAAVYEDNCEMCHEVGGVGIPEEIPPLADNPNLDDLEYLERVIREGINGPIEVEGVVYDDEMVGFPELSDGEVAALIDYIEAGFAAPTVVAMDQVSQPEILGYSQRGATCLRR